MSSSDSIPSSKNSDLTEDLSSDKISENAFDKEIEKKLKIKDKHAEGTANKLNNDDKFNKLSDNKTG